MSAFSDDELQAMERWENDVPFRVDWNQTSSTPESAPEEVTNAVGMGNGIGLQRPSVVQDGALDDVDVVRRELDRQQYALGDHDEPTAEARAALDRLTTRLTDTDADNWKLRDWLRQHEESAADLRARLQRAEEERDRLERDTNSLRVLLDRETKWRNDAQADISRRHDERHHLASALREIADEPAGPDEGRIMRSIALGALGELESGETPNEGSTG